MSENGGTLAQNPRETLGFEKRNLRIYAELTGASLLLINRTYHRHKSNRFSLQPKLKSKKAF